MLLSAYHRLVILMILFTTIAISFFEINWYLTAPNQKFLYLENSLDSISKTLIPAQYLSTTTNAASYWRPNKDKKFEMQEGRLSSEVLRNISTFVFFIGYSRSGHSIVGSILDAHPHIIVSNELQFMTKWSEIFSKQKDLGIINLFNTIYQSSINTLLPDMSRERNSKGYTLAIHLSWQGKFDKYIDVIGDKSGGGITSAYMNHKVDFLIHYKELKERLQIPIKVLHVIRNPYDTLSTTYLYHLGKRSGKSTKFVLQVKKRERLIEVMNTNISKNIIVRYFTKVKAIEEVTEIIGKTNILYIHLKDLVYNPRQTILCITNFLGVSVTEKYLHVCANKVFKTLTHSRILLPWSDDLKKMVDDRIKGHKMLRMYSFNSD